MIGRSQTKLLATLAAAFTVVFASRGSAADVDFSRDVLPILSDTCFQCHGPDEDTREAGLRLDTREGLLGELTGTAVVVAGAPEESDLIRRITAEDPYERMPPPDSNRSLSASQIDLLKRWVEQGARWEQHWAFVPPEQPNPPVIEDDSWVRNQIDSFVLATLQREGIGPSPEATRPQLIRRVTLDLTGLPPTPAEVDAFLADRSPDAYERLVDRLLSSPRYGERMVWDWLDAARYADTSGYQGDPERTMWPWRDWAVRAINDNMPFDQFTVEQLAGDLLPSATAEQVLATGFNRNHMHNGEGGRIAEETRVENVMDRAETTATVWLGLTMTCCRCHDHKYDPLTQKEYYRFYAFFNNTSEDGGGRGGQIPPAIRYPSREQTAQQRQLTQQIRSLASRLTTIEDTLFSSATAADAERDAAEEEAIDSSRAADGDSAAKLPKTVRAVLDTVPRERTGQQLGELVKHFRQEQPRYAQALADLKRAVEARDQLERNVPRVMVMDETRERETRLLVRGTYSEPTGEPLKAGVPAVLPEIDEKSSADRLALARWVVADDHPLTARVIVNRYWQTFFGTGLVASVEDFGAQGQRPSHPELLDWLATEFVRCGWDVKRLHRMIVTSATYRQSSRATPELLEHDPENRLLARGPRLRLPSWMIRDVALAASGLLVEQVGGPPVKPYQPEGLWAEATFGKKRYEQDHGEKLYRRSVYTFWRRIVGPPLFFDSAKRQTCTVKQTRTNTPLHALTTLNDVTYVEAARALAERALTGGGETDEARLEYVFRRATGRRPTAAEQSVLLPRLQSLQRQFAEDESSAARLVQVGESPRNESLDVVQHAAYTALASLILNLDETLTKQ